MLAGRVARMMPNLNVVWFRAIYHTYDQVSKPRLNMDFYSVLEKIELIHKALNIIDKLFLPPFSAFLLIS
jgi:hypothetical protein